MSRHLRKKHPPWLTWFMLVTPFSATMEFWGRYRRMARRRHPVRFFLQNDLPRSIKVLRRRWIDAIWWVRYRTIDKNHIIKTSLKPGYYETSYVMLVTNFELLVSFVEKKLAPRYMNGHCSAKSGEKHRLSNREAGLAYLNWEIADDEMLNYDPAISETSKIIRDLYIWWKDEYPLQNDPFGDQRIWEGIKKEEFFIAITSKDANQRKARQACSDTIEFYDNLNQEMLSKLISIRRHLHG